MGNGASIINTDDRGVQHGKQAMFFHKGDDRELAERLEWASQFIMILPIPVCLIDKKGFVHFTNIHFSEMINIPFDAERCPYIARFFLPNIDFRHAIEEIEASATIITRRVKAQWLPENTINPAANSKFEWSLCGSSQSDGVVLTGRYCNMSLYFIFFPNIPKKEHSKYVIYNMYFVIHVFNMWCYMYML